MQIKHKKIFSSGKNFFIMIIILLLLISGCKGRKSIEKALEEVRLGTEGIVMSFLPNAPPDKIVVEGEQKSEFDVILGVRNKGAYPQPEDKKNAPEMYIFLGGIDSKIFSYESKDEKSKEPSKSALEGRSTINPIGGLDIIGYTATIDGKNLDVEKFEPTLMVTACYHYETIASNSVCIDPNPYSTLNEKKVCEIHDITLSSQGAPIAVTQIDEEAFAKKTKFKITIKNLGNGDVLLEDVLQKCNPEGTEKILNDDINKVLLKSVKISNNQLVCGPFRDKIQATSGFVRLLNGEGFVICELSEYSNKISAYTSPMSIHISYGYRSSIEKKIQIKKEKI